MSFIFNLIKPCLFPINNILVMATKNFSKDFQPPKIGGVASLTEHIKAFFGTFPKIIISAVCWYYIFPLTKCINYEIDWILHIVLRDLAIMWFLGGAWDLILYWPKSPFYKSLMAVKFNKEYPSWDLFKFCIFWSNVSSFVGSIIQILYFHLLARNILPQTSELFTVNTFIWILTLNYWRISHFYFIHRFMHPWKTKYIPDFGKILYQLVHSLHHKSYNPTAWSGVSMHPVESFIYYTVSFIPISLGAHPIIMMIAIHDATLAAMWGHDGFGEPGSASYSHYLHHKLFDCNYGDNYFPLDWYFGSFCGEETLPNKDD